MGDIFDYFDGKSVPSNKPEPKKRLSSDDVPKIVDDELAKLGWSPNARLSMVANVGRENSWNVDTIFGGHIDPASYTKGRGKIENRGIISWNGDRKTNLDNYLKKQGVLGSGDENELRAMARFIDDEMRSSKEWSNIANAVRNPNISTKEASKLFQKYIKYVPGAPYNTPDDEFDVKANRKWAEKAKQLGLTQQQLKDYFANTADTTSPKDYFNDEKTPLPSPTVQGIQTVKTPEFGTDEITRLQQTIAQSQNPQRIAEAKKRLSQLQQSPSSIVSPAANENSFPTNVVPQGEFDKFGNQANPVYNVDDVDTSQQFFTRKDGKVVPIMPTTANQNLRPKTQNIRPQNQLLSSSSSGVPTEQQPGYKKFLSETQKTDSPEMRELWQDLVNTEKFKAEDQKRKEITRKIDLSGRPQETNPLDWKINTIASKLYGEGINPTDTQDYFRKFGFSDLATGKKLSKEEEAAREDFVGLSQADIDDIKEYSGQRRQAVADWLKERVLQGDFSQEELSEINKNYGLSEKDIQNFLDQPENAEIKAERERRKNFYNLAVEGNTTDAKWLADLKARLGAGWITEQQYNDAVAKQSEALKTLGERIKSPDTPNFTGISSARYSEQGISSTSANQEEMLKSLIGEKTPEQYLKWYVANENIPYLQKAAEAVKNLYRTIPNAVATVFKTSGQLYEYVDKIGKIYETSWDEDKEGNRASKIWNDPQLSAAKNGLTQIGNDIISKLDREAPQNETLKENFWTTAAPDAVGQVVTQIALGFATGGSTAPLIYGASQGFTEQAENAEKGGATTSQKLLVSVLGGLFAVPDALLAAKFAGLKLPAKLDFLSNLKNSIYRKLLGEIGESAARETTEGVMKTFIRTLPKKALEGAVFEGIQEGSEKKANEFVADVTYNNKSLKDAFKRLTTISQSDIDEAMGGAVGGLFGGGFESFVKAKEGVSAKEQFDSEFSPQTKVDEKMTALSPEALEQKIQAVNQQKFGNESPITSLLQEQIAENQQVTAEKPQNVAVESQENTDLETIIPETKDSSKAKNEKKSVQQKSPSMESPEVVSAPMAESNNEVIPDFDRREFEKYRQKNFPDNDASPEYIRNSMIDDTKQKIKDRDELREIAENGKTKKERERATKALEIADSTLKYRKDEIGKAFGKPMADYVGNLTEEIQPKPAVADTSASNKSSVKNQSNPAETSTKNISAEPKKNIQRVTVEPKQTVDSSKETVEETPITSHEGQYGSVTKVVKNAKTTQENDPFQLLDNLIAKIDANESVSDSEIQQTIEANKKLDNIRAEEWKSTNQIERAKRQKDYRAKIDKIIQNESKEKISAVLDSANSVLANQDNVTLRDLLGEYYVDQIKNKYPDLVKDTQVSTVENKDTLGEKSAPKTRSQIVADERSQKIQDAKENGISKDEREGLTKSHVQTETNNEIEEVPVSQRVDVENLEDSEFTRSEVLRKSKNEKIRSKTGFTKTQEEWFIGELQKAYDKLEPDARVVQMDAYRLQEVARNLVDKGGKYKGKSLDYARTTPEYLEAKQQYENDIKNAVVIDIPGDGTFKFSSAQGLNSIHKKLTGKTIEEFRKVKSSDYDFESLPKGYAKAGKEAEIRQEDETDITVAKVNEILGNAPETSEVLTKLGVKQISNGYWISNGRDGFTFVVSPKPISLKNLDGFDLFAHKYGTVPGNSSSKYSEWRISDAVTGLMLVSDNSLDGVIAKASNVKIEKFEKAISKSLADSPISPRYEKLDEIRNNPSKNKDLEFLEKNEETAKETPKSELPKVANIEAQKVAQEILNGRFEATVDDLNNFRKKYGSNIYIQGKNGDADSQHIVDIVADENLKTAPISKLEQAIARKNKQIEAIQARSYELSKESMQGSKANRGTRQVQLSRNSENVISIKNSIERIQKEIDIRNNPEPVAENETRVQPETKIEDFGEKIGGAKKDLWKERISKINADDIRTKPLSKSFPQPDYAQLVNDDVITLEGAKFLKFMYDSIPPKPRKSYRVEGWAKQVEEVVNLFKDLTENDKTKNTNFTDKILNAKGFSTIKTRFEIFSAIADEFGFPNNSVNTGSYEIRQMSVKDKNVWTIIANKSYIIKDFDTLEDAAKGLKTLLENQKSEVKTTKFDIYEDRKTKEIFIGKKDATGVVRIMEGFKSVKEASEFRKENQSQLENIWNGMKVKPEERNEVSRDRVGVDWRKGKNITPQEFSDAFGFRGVEFGNWVNNSERQQSINDAYDGLMDLANALGISPKALSLNGELGLAFGSRGGGRTASAHYESDKIVINLTKTKGKGSLGHEWWHALDNYFSRMRGENDNYVTEKPRSILVKQDNKWVEDSAVRKEMLNAFKGIVDAVKSTDLPKRSTILDRTKTKRYWSTMLEMTARSFENFLINKLGQNNERNDYLANFKDTAQWITDSKLSLDNYPYPQKDEQEVINNAYQNFFNTIEQEETEQGVALKSVAEIYDNQNIGFSEKYIQAEQKQFAKDVETVLNRTAKRGDTPQVLSAITPLFEKLGMTDAEILMPQSVVVKAEGNGTGQHNIAPEVLKQLPFELNSPVMVFESLSNPDAITVLTNLENREGFPVIAAIVKDGKIGGDIVNVIPSVHEKNSLIFIRDWLRKNKLKFINKEKSQSWFQKVGLQLSETETQKLTSSNVLTEDDFVNKPLKKVRETSDADEQIRVATIPQHELFDGFAKFDGENIELDVKAAENLRRHLAELHFEKFKTETDESIFDGLTMNKSQMRDLVRILRKTYNTALNPRMGYTKEDLAGHESLLNAMEQLYKSTPVGVVYVFDDALPEELFHKLDLLSGRTDAKAASFIQATKIFQNTIKPGTKFHSQYGNQNLQNVISEIVAKLATNQAERYGWTNLFDSPQEFEQAKEELLNAWADGVLRKNPKLAEDLANQIKNYATKQQGFSGKVYRGINAENINKTYGGISDDGIGTFYTDNLTMAKWFGGLVDFDGDRYAKTDGKGKVETHNISLKNPYVIDENSKGFDRDDYIDSVYLYFNQIKEAGSAEKYREQLQAKGYDGIILRNATTNYYENGEYSVIITFDKTYAKEAQTTQSETANGSSNQSAQGKKQKASADGIDQQSDSGTEEESEDQRYAAGVSEEQSGTRLNLKNRQYAETLRESGRDAYQENVAYLPESEKGWTENARAIIEKSQKADLNDPFAKAIDEFNNSSQPDSFRAVLGVALIDHLGASGDYEQMRQVADETVKIVGTAGQVLRASQIVSKYDFAKAIEIATRGMKKIGKELNNSEIEEIKQKTARYAEAAENASVNSQMIEEIQSELDATQQDLEDLANAYSELQKTDQQKTTDLAEAKKQGTIAKRLATFYKNKFEEKNKAKKRRWVIGTKLLRETLATTQTQDEELLQNWFGGIGLKSVSDTLKSAANIPLTDEQSETLIRQIQRYITAENPLSYKDTINKILDITNGRLTIENVKSLHSEAVKGIRKDSVDVPQMSAEERETYEKNKEIRKIRNEHRAKARAFERIQSATDSLSPLNRKIVEEVNNLQIPTDEKEKLTTAIILLNTVSGAKAWNEGFESAYNLGKAENDKWFVRATELKTDLKKQIVNEQYRKQAEKKKWEGSLESYKQFLLDSRKAKRDAQKSLDSHYRELNKTKTEKIIDGILFPFDMMRTAMSTGEVSQIGRQGFPTLLTFSKEWAKSLKGIQTGLGDENTRFAYIQAIENDADFQESVRFGMPYASFGENSVGDEHFPTDRFINKLADKEFNGRFGVSKIPFIGTALSKLAKGQQKLERAYTDPADLQRYFVYKTFKSIIESQGLNEIEAEKAKKQAVYYAQILSGKGSLPKVFGEKSIATRLLTGIGFAPNLLASRIETAFYFNPVIGPALAPKGLKMTMFKKGLRMYSIPALLALAFSAIFQPDDDDDKEAKWYDVLNPKSNRFMKVKIRGTDINLDVSSGLSEFQRMLFYDWANLIYSGITEGKEGFVNTAKSLAEKEKDTFFSTRFIRSKLSPGASLGVDLASGSDFIGRPINWKEGGYWGAITSRMSPLTWQSVYDSLFYDENYSLTKEPQTFTEGLNKYSRFSLRNVPASILLGAIQGVGLAGTQFERRHGSLAENVAWSMYSNDYEAKNPQLSRVKTELRNLFRKRETLLSAGKDVKGVDKVIEEIKTKYAEFGNKIVRDAQEQAVQGKFDFVTRKFDASQIKQIMQVATPNELKELQKILEQKERKQIRKERIETRKSK